MIILSTNLICSPPSQTFGCLALHINSIYQIKSILNVMQSSNRFNFSKIINLWYDWKFENNIFLFLIFIFLHIFFLLLNFFIYVKLFLSLFLSPSFNLTCPFSLSPFLFLLTYISFCSPPKRSARKGIWSCENDNTKNLL